MAVLIRKMLADGLQNLVANLGTPRDKAAHSQYTLPMLTEAEAENAYRGSWLPRKIIDIPALDAARNWRGWNAESDEVSKIEAEEKRLGLTQKMLQAHIKARLYGGAAIYIGTGQANAGDELRPDSIGSGGLRHLNVLSKRVLHAGDLDRNPESPTYGLPAFYTLSTGASQVQIHPSRLVILHGAGLPDSESATQTNGWGDSVLTAVMDAVKNADATSANIASLVFEAKVDVIRIPDLMRMLSDPTYEAQMLKRLQLAAMAKGINGTLILDKEEEYDQKKQEFGSLRDILMAYMQLACGAADIPATRMLGQAPGGLNASGESDIRNYYDRIRAIQELTLTPAMGVLDECLIRSALGSRPPEVHYNWRSLWQTTEKERADIGKVTAETIKVMDDTGLIPDDVMAKVAQNMLTEAGVAPGLEAALDEYQKANSAETGDDEGDDAAAELVAAQLARAALADAQPRSLYVRRDVVNAAEIKRWAESQGIADVADDLHVTIAYSRKAFDWIKAGNASDWGSDGKDTLTIPEGGPRAVEPLGGMSAVILFASSQLVWRHQSIVEAGAWHDFPDYTPHISLTKSPVDLTKVEPYRGQIVLGPEIFEELDED